MLNATLGTTLNERLWAVGAGWFGSGAGRGEGWGQGLWLWGVQGAACLDLSLCPSSSNGQFGSGLCDPMPTGVPGLGLPGMLGLTIVMGLSASVDCSFIGVHS